MTTWAGLRLGEVAANFAKFTRPLCKPALSPSMAVPYMAVHRGHTIPSRADYAPRWRCPNYDEKLVR
jgi:hypothetical protein